MRVWRFEGRRTTPIECWMSLAVAGSFHGIVGQGLRLGQCLFNCLLTCIGSRKFLADLGCDTGKLGNGRKLDTHIWARINGRVVRIGRQD